MAHSVSRCRWPSTCTLCKGRAASGLCTIRAAYTASAGTGPAYASPASPGALAGVLRGFEGGTTAVDLAARGDGA